MDMGLLLLTIVILATETFSQSENEPPTSCPRWPNTFGEQPAVCSTRWIRAYVHDGDGQRLANDIGVLKRAVREGWNIKVDFELENLGIVTTPWSAYIKGASVCAEVLVHVGVQWSFMTKCTNGDKAKKTYQLDTEKGANLLKSKSGVTTWFVRPEGNAVQINASFAYLTQGAGVRIAVNKSDETNPLFTYLSSRIPFVSVYKTPAESIAESMWLHEIDFNPTDSINPSRHHNWSFRRWFANDTFLYEDQPITSSGQNVPPNELIVPATWVIDPCWDLVFISRSKQDGNWGNFGSLLWHIKQGHRVKAIFQGVSMEADTILVRNDHITAQFVSQVEHHNGTVDWVWQLVSTEGRIQTVTNVEGTTDLSEHADVYNTVEWYVDTRSWREILSEGLSYNITCGSRLAYVKSIRNGHDMRLALHYRDYSVYVTPDSVGIRAHVQASFNRGIGYKIDRKSDTDFKFHLPPYWDFFYLRSGPSNYLVSRLRRVVGTNVPVLVVVPELVYVQWYAGW